MAAFPIYEPGTPPVIVQANAGQLGLLYNIPPPRGLMFRMRARLISSGSYVQWSVSSQPDATGVYSGHFGDVTDVVVLIETYRNQPIVPS